MQCIERTNSKGTVYLFRETYRDKQGKRVVVSTTKKHNSRQAYREAKEELDKKFRERILEPVRNIVQISKTLTFQQVLTAWAEQVKPSIKLQTAIEHQSRIKKLLSLLPSGILLKDFTVDMAEEVVRTMYFTERLSAGYVKAVLGIIKNSLRYAKKKGYLESISDFLEIVLPRRVPTPEEIEKARNKFLTHEELADCLHQIKRKNERVGLAMEFMSLTGLREGELLALKAEDIDLDKKEIHVRFTMVQALPNGHEMKRWTPKNEYSVRTIDINERSKAILEWFITENKGKARWTPDYHEQGYIFTGRTGQPLNPNTIKRVLDRVSIPGKKITSHIFRHTHISWLAEEGFQIKEIMERVGHHKPETTLSVYTHVTDKMKKDNRPRLEQMTV